MKHLYFLFLSICISATLFSQNNLIQWQKSYGGSSYDGAYQIKQTADGGYVVAGYSWSGDQDVHGHHGTNGWSPDGWIVKIKANGDTLWTKSLGGTWDDYANAIIETDDGKYVVALQTQSNDGDVSVALGSWDYWVVKLDTNGAIIWEKSYGGSSSDYAYAIIQATDGNYVVAGYSTSTNGDIVGNKGGSDFWVIKVDKNNGSIIWKKNYGGSDYDQAMTIANTFDNGFVVAGYTYSSDGDVTVNQGWKDFWVINIDNSGNLIWQKSMGGDYYDVANAVAQTTDSGFIVAGATLSAGGTGDVSVSYGSYDYWIVKLNQDGTQIEWEKSLGGSLLDVGYSIVQSSDNGYMVAGYSKSNNNDVSGNHGMDDYWAAKLDTSGNIQWSGSFGGDSLDYCTTVIQTNDGGYIMAGLSQSPNEDVDTNRGKEDFWVVKTFCTPPYTPEICLVTVDDIASTKNLIVWEKPALASIDSFRVYRDVVGNYTYLGSVAYEDLGKFTDNTMGVNPQVTSYKYKISSVDTCGNESPMSSFHKTIHLQINGANLTWDNYSGFTSTFYYRILRDTTATGIFTVLDSVTNSNFTWTDTLPSVLNPANYIVEVVHPDGGCTVTKSVENHNSSRSNRASSAPAGSLPEADFSASSTTISPGTSVDFTDITSNNPISWFWYFSGGNPPTSTVQHPQNIVFTTTGCHDVTLVAGNASGSDSTTKTCFIDVIAGSAPVADFTATAVNIAVGDSVSFFDLSQNSPTQWQWIFTNGNPATSTSQNPANIKYNNAGCFNVTLIATNTFGSNNSLKTCYINVNPVGDGELFSSGTEVKINPNPNRGIFEVEIISEINTWKIEVSNLLGQKIYESDYGTNSGNKGISIKSEKGIYFFKATAQNGHALVRKVVVE